MTNLTEFFPKGATPRKQQVQALKRIQEIWDSGKKIAIGCLPTGIGKSHIAKAVGSSAKTIEPHLKYHIENYAIYNKREDSYVVAEDFLNAPSFGSFILTITKQLQDQYQTLFFDGFSIKGKNNYQCDLDDSFTADFAPCTLSPKQKQRCFSENNCPYYKTRNNALIDKSPVLNYSVFLNLPDFLQKREILIMDEAAELEDELVSKYTLTLNYKNLRFEGIPHKHLLNDKPSEALKWLSDIYSEMVKEYEDSVAEAHKSFSSEGGMGAVNSRLSGKISRLNNLISSADLVISNWKRCEYMVETMSKEQVTFAPYDIRPLARQILDKADKVLMMSATLSDVEEYAKSLGLHADEYEYFEIESPFEPSKSPIICSTKYPLSFKTMDQMLPKVVEAAIDLCEQHKNEKGVIHTHTHKITEEFRRQLGNDPRYLFREEGKTNQEILDIHFNSTEPTVLISPSLDTGVSLDDDKGRFQIIMKAPYLPLGSNRIKKMFKENPKHYQAKMMNNIIQMCGRCTRSVNDYSVTYILDGTAVKAIQRDAKKLPKHFLERFV